MRNASPLWRTFLRSSLKQRNIVPPDPPEVSAQQQARLMAQRAREWSTSGSPKQRAHLLSRIHLLSTTHVGGYVVCGGRDTRLYCVDPSAPGEVQSSCAHRDCVSKVVHVGGSRIASASNDGTVQFHQLPCAENGEELTHLCGASSARGGHTRAITDCVALGAHGTAASSSKDSTVKLWRPGTAGGARLMCTLEANECGAQFNMATLARGAQLVVGGYDGVVRVWDLHTQKLLSERGDMCSWITEVQSDPSNNRFFVSDKSGLLRGFDTRTMAPCLFLKASQVALGHRWSVSSFRLAGDALLCARSDGVLLYDVRQSARSLSWLGAAADPALHVRLTDRGHLGPRTAFVSRVGDTRNYLECYRISALTAGPQDAHRTIELKRRHPSEFSVSPDASSISVAYFDDGADIIY